MFYYKRYKTRKGDVYQPLSGNYGRVKGFLQGFGKHLGRVYKHLNWSRSESSSLTLGSTEFVFFFAALVCLIKIILQLLYYSGNKYI